MPEEIAQDYTYQVEKTTFIVTPIYREKAQGEAITDILLKLMKADIDRIPEASASLTSAVGSGII